MQHDEQERHYGENPFAHKKERVGYLNLQRICEEQHTFVVGKDEPKLKDKTDEEAKEILREMKKDFEAKYTIYIGHALLQFKDRACVVAPYNFK
jgi:hypothetical protein